MQAQGGAGSEAAPATVSARFWEHQGSQIGPLAQVWALGIHKASALRDARGALVGGSLSDLGESWMFFVDPTPEANWAHPCAYVAIDVVNGRISQVQWLWPPADGVMMDRIECPTGGALS